MTDIHTYCLSRGMLNNDGTPYTLPQLLAHVDELHAELDKVAASDKWFAARIAELEAEAANTRMLSPAMWKRVVALGYVAGSGNPVVWMVRKLEEQQQPQEHA